MGQKRAGYGEEVELFLEMILEGANKTAGEQENGQGQANDAEKQ